MAIRLCQRPARRLRSTRGPACRLPRQNRDRAVRRKLPRCKVYIAEQRGAIGVPIYPIRKTMDTTKAMRPLARGDPRLGYNAALFSFSSNIPATCRHSVSLLRLIYPTAREPPERQPTAHHLHPAELSRCLTTPPGPQRPQCAAGLVSFLFRYHIGASGVRVHLGLSRTTRCGPSGTSSAKSKVLSTDEWVVAGNHRDVGLRSCRSQ